MTHADFAQEVTKEWNLKPRQMSEGCYKEENFQFNGEKTWTL